MSRQDAYLVDVFVRDGSIVLRISRHKIDIIRDGDYEVVEMTITPEAAETLARRLFRASRLVIPIGAKEVTKRVATAEAKAAAAERAARELASEVKELRGEVDEVKKILEEIRRIVSQTPQSHTTQ